ncbi:hypothetical protein Nepgr_032075 [Nepenthes gracilis]|uniref:4a-hydroxytetrahydrobiopterin dehydratase n=1 Tax=Nepenthes gracilis TaxID=150966 RepID=A0AAD3TIS5_NEPGR|nr:hypothetical protein Nepgr_032075 [Nepenthes gracilis]
MKITMSGKCNDNSTSMINKTKNSETQRYQFHGDSMNKTDIWTDGLICAFEYERVRRKAYKSQPSSKSTSSQQLNGDNLNKRTSLYKIADSHLQNGNYREEPPPHLDLGADHSAAFNECSESQAYQPNQFSESHWVPIGWARIYELVQMVQVDSCWSSQQLDFMEDEDDVTVAELATPYYERPAGPIWWCHMDASHQNINSWLSNAHWLHPAISVALRDESFLISERMKYLLYEVPVRVAGGLLFELLGQSAGDPFCHENDIPVVLRSWQAQNFLITSMHIKGSSPKLNVLGVMEVQELLVAGGYNAPITVHEVIAHLACRLARWDDRLFRKSIFGAADELELKFMNRRTHEDMNLFGVILNQEIRKLSRQVIRVKWSLHAREEIVFELLQHLRGNAARNLLEGLKRSTREMIEEQEAVRGRLFTIQDVMQSTVRAWLQDRSLRVTHNLAVFGGCGLILSIITGLFGINVDGIPGAKNTPYAFGVFASILCFIGIILIGIGLLYLGLKQPISDEEVEVRKLELDELVRLFQHEAETHAQVRNSSSRSWPRIAGGKSMPEMIPLRLLTLSPPHVLLAPRFGGLFFGAHGRSSTQLKKIQQNHVKVSKSRKILHDFRMFCTATDLSAKNCVPCNSKDMRPMNEQSANDLIAKIPGWNLVNEGGKLKLSRSWKVKSFMKGLEFFGAVADVAETQGHHPDLHLVGWNNATIEIWTHAVGGLTENDFILAAKIDGLEIANFLRRKAAN